MKEGKRYDSKIYLMMRDSSYRENETSKKMFSFKYKALNFTMYVSSEFQ